VGFSSVYECRNPVDSVWVNGEFRLHADFVTLIAFKGTPASVSARPEVDWPENPATFYMERPWLQRSSANDTDAIRAERDAALNESSAVRAQLAQVVAEKDALLAECDSARAQLSKAIVETGALLAERDTAKTQLSKAVADRDALLASTSWRLSAPVR